MELNYDLSVIKNSSIKTMDDLINLIEISPCVIFSGSFGLGKSRAANIIEKRLTQEDKDYYIVNLVKSNVESIRKTIEEFKQIHLSDKQKMIIINEIDTSSNASIDELRGHVDETDSLQFKILLLTNKEDTLPALNDRSVYVKFIEVPLTQMMKNQKDSLEKMFTKEQLLEMYNLAKDYEKDGVICSYRQFVSIINVIKKGKSSIQDSFDSVLNANIDIPKIENLNKYLFNVYKNPSKLDIKEMLKALNTLKTHQEILYLFNYSKFICAEDKANDAWFKFNRAKIEYLSINKKIYSDLELKQNKADILMDVLYRAKII